MQHSPGADDSAPQSVVTWRDLAPVLARVSVLEQQAPALQQQIDQLGQHLAQQDQAAASAQQQTRSQLGVLQAKLDTLIAERERETAAVRDAEMAAQQRHADTVARLRRWLAGVALFVATSTWPLLAGLPVRERLILLGAGVLVSCAAALVEWARTRPHAHRP